MLYTVLGGSTRIEAEDIETAWSIVSYLSDGALSLAGKVSTNGRGRALAELEPVIERKALAGSPIRATPGYMHRAITTSKRGLIDNWGGVAQLLESLGDDERICIAVSTHEDDGRERSYYYTPSTVPGAAGALLALEIAGTAPNV